jgi:hypothetical protein
VGLIGHHDDAFGGGQAGGDQVVGILQLLNGGRDQIGGGLAQEGLQGGGGGGGVGRFSLLGVLNGFGELVVELGAVAEEEQLEGAEEGITANLEDQGLTEAMGVLEKLF